MRSGTAGPTGSSTSAGNRLHRAARPGDHRAADSGCTRSTARRSRCSTAPPGLAVAVGGRSPGPDVAQLDRNLIALGFGKYLTVSDYYTAATAYAVELWQQAAGLPVTGTVPLGQVAFAPGALRVAGVTAGVGSPPQPGAAVLTATSPVPVVTAQLPVSQEYLVHAGDHVTVTMPDGVTTTPGVVTAVSSVATAGTAARVTGQGTAASRSLGQARRRGRPGAARTPSR